MTSNRLDCYVAAISKTSREKAVSAIKAGDVRLNGTQIYDVTKRLSFGDRLSVRGAGKYIVDSDSEDCHKTQKDRLKINMQKYERSK